MRIGIIGSGGAGLTSAWLLDEHHDVTVFEKDDRLGGHAHTIDIDVHGQSIAVDAGFQFFARSQTYAAFTRLLDELGVEREDYPATLTVSTLGGDQPTGPAMRHPGALVMPPFRRGRPLGAALHPASLRDLLRFRLFLGRLPAFLARHDTTITIADYLEGQRLPRRFVDEFLLPLLLAFWCVEPDEFRGFAAYNVLYYLGANVPRGLSSPVQSAVTGGLKVYIEALAGGISRGHILMGNGVVSLERQGTEWVIVDAAGIHHRFDQVVVATNAEQALQLISPVTGCEAIAAQLARFEYFDTTIAIHGDRRLMPAQRSDWSVVNARWDGMHSQLSAWDPRRALPVFKSWVTFDEALPEPLYATATYRHGKITPEYFDAQQQLRPLQGERGLWLAGLYTADADSHESAICSAMAVASRLTPDSARLRALRG